jgi:hypothetical protein
MLTIALVAVTEVIGQVPSTADVVKLARVIACPAVHGGAVAKFRVKAVAVSLAEVGTSCVV